MLDTLLQLFGSRINSALGKLSPASGTWVLAAALVAYVTAGWAWALFPIQTPTYLATVYLFVAPLLAVAFVDFQEGQTWARAGGLAWMPLYVLIRAVAWAFGGLITLLRKHGKAILSGGRYLYELFRSGDTQKAAPTAEPTREIGPTEAEPAEATDSQVGQQPDDAAPSDAEALGRDSGLEGVRTFFRTISPRTLTQLASGLAWLLWLAAWVAPVFVDLSRTWSLTRLIFGLGFPALILGILLGVEYAYRPFPFWRTTVGMLWTPAYTYLRLVFRVFFLRPEALQALLRRVWFLRKLYYPAALFLLFNRRYLTYLLAAVIMAAITVATDRGHVLTIALFLGLYVIEAGRLIGQLREVRYLGVADFGDLSATLTSGSTEGQEKLDEGRKLAGALQRYMFVRLARRVLDETGDDDSYFATVVSILLKHVITIGFAVAALRVFFEAGFRQNPEMDTFDTVVNSLILLFGEVTFTSSDGFLAVVNLLGVAASFLLLGLGLTYLSGKAHDDYRDKAARLREQIEAFEQGPEMALVREGALREGFDKLGRLSWWDLYELIAKANRKT